MPGVFELTNLGGDHKTPLLEGGENIDPNERKREEPDVCTK